MNIGGSGAVARRACALAATFAVLCGGAATLPASASGVTKIQHADGTRNEYPGATIRLDKSKQEVTITSPDGRDTLIVDGAACSYVGDLQRCLLGNVTIKHKDGTTHPIAFDQGTIYLNLTAEKHTLPLSSREVPANGLVFAMHTRRGTFINVTGTFDGAAQ
jgi:hypothetical protein